MNLVKEKLRRFLGRRDSVARFVPPAPPSRNTELRNMLFAVKAQHNQSGAEIEHRPRVWMYSDKDPPEHISMTRWMSLASKRTLMFRPPVDQASMLKQSPNLARVVRRRAYMYQMDILF